MPGLVLGRITSEVTIALTNSAISVDISRKPDASAGLVKSLFFLLPLRNSVDQLSSGDPELPN